MPGVIPIPGLAFPTSPKDAYGSAQSLGEPMVRADTTYLRQDFSVLMPVTGATPWPDMQRFDFLIRKRIVEGKELATLQAMMKDRGVDFVSENQKARSRCCAIFPGKTPLRMPRRGSECLRRNEPDAQSEGQINKPPA